MGNTISEPPPISVQECYESRGKKISRIFSLKKSIGGNMIVQGPFVTGTFVLD